MEQQRTHQSKARLEGDDDDLQAGGTNQECRRKEILQGIENRTVHFKDLPEELRDDAEIARAAIKKAWAWSNVSRRLKSNKEFILEAVQQNGSALYYASEELRADPDVVLIAVRKHGEALEYASEEVRGNQDVVLEAVRKAGRALASASEKLRGVHKIVLAAVRQEGWALQYASEELRGDRKIVMAAVQQYGGAVRWASEELRADRNVVLQAVRRYGTALEYASEELRADRKIVSVAVGQRGHALLYASRELRSDRGIVLEAVRQDGEVLRFASEELRDDQEVVLAALDSTNRFSLESLAGCISDRLKSNREFVLTAVKVFGEFLEHASEDLRADREIVWMAIQQSNGKALFFASEELRGRRDIVVEAVRRNGLALGDASEELRADRVIVLIAVQQCGGALRYASLELRRDREIVQEAVRQHGMALQFASEDLRSDREIVLVAFDNIDSCPVELLLVEVVPNDLQNDPLIAGAIVRKDGHLRRGSEIMERLVNVLLAVQALPKDFVHGIVSEESVVELSRRWEHLIWHKIWLTLQLEPSGMPGTGKLFVRLSGLHLELRQVKELRHCAPVIGAVLSFPDRDWRDLDSYPACDRV